jgi:hypothetical protein
VSEKGRRAWYDEAAAPTGCGPRAGRLFAPFDGYSARPFASGNRADSSIALARGVTNGDRQLSNGDLRAPPRKRCGTHAFLAGRRWRRCPRREYAEPGSSSRHCPGVSRHRRAQACSDRKLSIAKLILRRGGSRSDAVADRHRLRSFDGVVMMPSALPPPDSVPTCPDRRSSPGDGAGANAHRRCCRTTGTCGAQGRASFRSW